jgi:hypothetical protein
MRTARRASTPELGFAGNPSGVLSLASGVERRPGKGRLESAVQRRWRQGTRVGPPEDCGQLKNGYRAGLPFVGVGLPSIRRMRAAGNPSFLSSGSAAGGAGAKWSGGGALICGATLGVSKIGVWLRARLSGEPRKDSRSAIALNPPNGGVGPTPAPLNTEWLLPGRADCRS